MTPHTPVRQAKRGPVHHPRHARSTRCLPPQEGRPMNISRSVHAARLRVIILAAALAIAGLLFAAGQAGSAHAAAARTTHASTATWAGGPEPTIVVVHRAWADASIWVGVIPRPQAECFAPLPPPNPLPALPLD